MKWIGIVAAAGFVAAGGAHDLGAVQTADLAGRYDFESVTVEGEAFTGTILAHAEGEGYGGFIITTVNSVGRVLDMEHRGDRVWMHFDVSGRDVEFDVAFDNDEFSGGWTLMDLEGTLTGQRVATNARGDLDPVPCRMRGLRDLGRCGILHVPENRADPESRWIPLNVYVLPAQGVDAPKGALFHFAGGPGQASTQQAAGNANRFGAILDSRDIVMIDQRGTGGSNPLRCPAPNPLAHVRTILAWDLPEQWVKGCAETLREVADLTQYTTAAASHDVEAVREWLGYDQIDLYGGSYGTRAALEYARYYPESVRTVTLRGVMPPTGIMAIENPINLEISLERALRECGEDVACAAAFPNLRDEYADLLDRLESGTDTAMAFNRDTGDSLAVPIDRRVLAGSIRRMLMDAEGWVRVPLAIHLAHSSDWSGIVPGIEGTLGITNSLFLGMSLSVMCAEEAPRLRALDPRAETAGTLMGHWPAEGILGACDNWDAGKAGPGYGEPVRVESPMLIVSGALDPTTPVSWGKLAADAALDDLHLVLEGVSHSPFPDCALGVMANFVAAGSLQGLDTSCVSRLRRKAFRLE